jgi:REP element-mobilizing transposase RayT
MEPGCQVIRADLSLAFERELRIACGTTLRAPIDQEMPGLQRSAQTLLQAEPVRLCETAARVLFQQFQETATIRHWKLLACAIMANHIHVVLGVPGDPDPAALLPDLKSYGSRALNRFYPGGASDRWWTQSGSRRILRTRDAVLAAARYVRDQEYPCLVWVDPLLATELGSRIGPSSAG